MSGELRIAEISVGRDLSGGVRLKFGPANFVLAPQDAVKYAAAVLQAAGVNVEFSNPGQSIIKPQAPRLVS